MSMIFLSDSGRTSSLRGLYRRLVGRQRSELLVYLGLLLVVVALQLPLPYLFGGIIDEISRQEPRGVLMPLIVGMAGLSGLSLALATGSKVYAAAIALRFQSNLRLAVFGSLQNSPWSFVRQFDISDLRSRLAGDVATLQYLVPTGIASAIRDVFLLLLFGGLLVYQSPAIAGSLFVFVPLAVFIFRMAGARLSKLSDKARRGYAEADAAIHESLQSLRESRINETCSFHLGRLGDVLQRSDTAFLAMHRQSGWMIGLLGMIPVVITSLIWSIGQAQVEAQALSVGRLLSLFLLLSMLYSPVSALFNLAAGYVYEVAALKRIGHLIQGEVACEKVYTLENSLISAPALALKDVVFSYEGRPVFSKISGTIASGCCIALAGENGTGKSTLALILLGLERSSSGVVSINGGPMPSSKVLTARVCCAYVPQDVFMFAGSLRANIITGRPIQDHAVRELLDELGWSETMFGEPVDLDQMISEGGSHLSGGQRQKIALLRALVGKPSLLVLDEPDKDLDHGSLCQLVTYLARIKANSTIILITHSKAFEPIIDDTLRISGGDSGQEQKSRDRNTTEQKE